MWAGEEGIKRIANGAGHRDMAGDHEIEWQAGDFDITQRRIKLRARCDQRADQIISRVVCALSDGCEKVTLQRDCAFSVRDSLLDRPGLLHQKPIVAPFMQLREVFSREAEKFAKNTQRQRPSERADHVSLAFLRKLTEEFIDDTANRRLKRFDPARRECFGGQPADSIMQRWIDLDDVRHVAVSVREHRGDCLRQRGGF